VKLGIDMLLAITALTTSSKESGHVLRHLSLCFSETHLHLLDG
jgi:hypothetical protein